MNNNYIDNLIISQIFKILLVFRNNTWTINNKKQITINNNYKFIIRVEIVLIQLNEKEK